MTATADRDVHAAFLKELAQKAASPYQRSSGFAWRFAKGKLARDRLFETLLATGAIPDAACLVDLGCGQALLATWIHAARNAFTAQPDAWPAAWPAAPKVSTYLGVDQSRKDIARAKPAMPAYARVFRGDVRAIGLAMLDRCDVVALLDVLQYFDTAAQERLVDAIAKSIPPWGVVVLRIGDGTTISSHRGDVVDWIVCALRGHPRWRMHRRTLSEWRALFERSGFVVEVLHDERGDDDAARAAGRFANVLLRASRPQPDAVAQPAPAEIAPVRSPAS